MGQEREVEKMYASYTTKHVVERIKELIKEGRSFSAIGNIIEKEYGKPIRKLTGKSLSQLVGFGKRGIYAIRGAKLVKNKPELRNKWIRLESLKTNRVEILNFADGVWRFHHHKKKKSLRYPRKIYPYIREIIGKDPHIRFRSEKERREGVLAYRIWLLITGKDKKLRRRRLKQWKGLELKIEI